MLRPWGQSEFLATLAKVASILGNGPVFVDKDACDPRATTKPSQGFSCESEGIMEIYTEEGFHAFVGKE